MLTLLTEGEYSDYGIRGLYDFPEGFDLTQAIKSSQKDQQMWENAVREYEKYNPMPNFAGGGRTKEEYIQIYNEWWDKKSKELERLRQDGFLEFNESLERKIAQYEVQHKEVNLSAIDYGVVE